LIKKQHETIEALSVSLIPLSEDIAVLPLIGNFDPHRVSNVRQNLTEGLHSRFHKVVILDITGIPSIDEQAVEGLVKIAKAARLMGAQVIMTGIQPDMAIEMTELGLTLDGISTENSLQSGIEAGMKIVNTISKNY